MARVAVAFAAEQIVPGHLVGGQCGIALQEGIEFRGERTDRVTFLECAKGLGPVIVHLIRTGAVRRTERNLISAPANIRHGAYLRNVGWEIDGERALSPYLLKKRPVYSQRKLVSDAGGVRVAHFQRIDRRKLCLLGIRGPEQISGCAGIPEISAKEGGLCGVVLQQREVTRICVSLRRTLAGTEVEGPGIRDHGQIHRWNRPAEGRVRHVAGRTGYILVGRDISVEVHELAEYLY